MQTAILTPDMEPNMPLLTYKPYFANNRALSSMAIVTVCCVLGACQSSPPKGILLDDSTYQSIKSTLSDPTSSASRALEALAKSTPPDPDPFQLPFGETFEFGWCRPAVHNRTLKDLTERLTNESAYARDDSIYYLYSGDHKRLQQAIDRTLAWTKKSTLFNGYQLGMAPEQGSFPGMQKGFCNNSWNMMLDSIWQAYGLINFSQVYLTLKQSDQANSHAEDIVVMHDWLQKQLVPAVNAGLHAWTRWADAHPTSKAYERYRNDNHISWSLAGLAAAALALNDKPLMSYVYEGTAYDDGYSGLYRNPSNLKTQLENVISSTGQIYDEPIRTPQHKGFFYGNFSLWALVMATDITERAGYPALWNHHGQQGGSILTALDYYAPLVAGQQVLPDPNEKTQPGFFNFTYQLMLNKTWLTPEQHQRYSAAANNNRSDRNILQGPGRMGLLTRPATTPAHR
jgi:hypothetical protein